MKEFRILNLGAGVQSTTIALRIAKGDLPPIHAAIFADTQEEPQAVYRHLNWLIEQTKKAFPTLIRTCGKLGDDLLQGRNSTGGRFASIPCFTKGDGDEREGITRRQCTVEYKVEVIDRAIRREIFGLKPRQHFPRKEVRVVQLMGLSADEAGRIARVRKAKSTGPYNVEFPLFDSFETRANCQAYLKAEVPHEVPKSACVFCPYHDNCEWRKIKANDQTGWSRAIEIDNALRIEGTVVNRNMNKKMYLHRSCVPLEQADLSGPDEKPLQYGFNFARECEGMCGV